MDRSRRRQIIASFGALQEHRPALAGRETTLPYPKAIIRLALLQEILEEDLDDKTRNALEVGVMFLESFVPDSEAEPFERFQEAMEAAKPLMASGDPSAAKKVASMLAAIPDFPDMTCTQGREADRLRLMQELRQLREEAIRAGGTVPPQSQTDSPLARHLLRERLKALVSHPVEGVWKQVGAWFGCAFGAVLIASPLCQDG